MNEKPRMPVWRRVSRAIYDRFFEWVHKSQVARMEHGIKKYKSCEEGFKGDPLQHASEEVFDAIFYVYYAMRERDQLLEENECLRKKLATARRTLDD